MSCLTYRGVVCISVQWASVHTLLPLFTTHWHIEPIDMLKRAVLYLLKVLEHKKCFQFLFFLPITFITQTTLWKWDGNISRWTQSATTRIQIHTQACYKTSPMLIFTGLSVGLPLQNPIRETCSIKGLRKSLRRSTKNMSALEVPSLFFFKSLNIKHNVIFPPQFLFKLTCRHIQLSAAP